MAVREARRARWLKEETTVGIEGHGFGGVDCDFGGGVFVGDEDYSGAVFVDEA